MAGKAVGRKEMVQIPADEARQSLGDLIDRAGFLGERILITRHGKPVVALVSISDVQRLGELKAAS